jgi:hypothetical protein
MSSRRRNERSRDSLIDAAQPEERVYILPAPSKNKFIDRTLQSLVYPFGTRTRCRYDPGRVGQYHARQRQ